MDAVNYDGQTAFDAAANGDFPLVVLLWGMAMAVHPQPVDLLGIKDKGGNSLVHYAAASCEDTCDTMHFLMQQLQVTDRQDELLDAKNDAGETPLMRAAHAGNIQLADTLLQSGYVDLLAKDARGNSAAHHAAAQGHLWMLHLLLQAEQRNNASVKQDIETTTLGGYSLQYRNVLHYACMSEYKPMVQYLLIRGFDPKEVDAEGKTCVDVAKQRHLLELEDLLAGKTQATEPPTHMRKTRGIVAVLHGAILLAILATSYWLVWWLAVPLILVALGTSLLAFRQGGHGHGGHGHGGHSHGAASKGLADIHPSKRNVALAMNVSLASIEEGPTAAMAARSNKIKDETSVGLHTLTRPQPESIMGIWMAWVGLFITMYVVLWVDPQYRHFVDTHKLFMGFVGGMKVVFLLVWMKLAFLWPTDPGRISTYEHDVKVMLENAAHAEPPDTTKFCRTCLVLKPIRSKHCAQCGICIARHDHHCAWINRCVGYDNHRSFLAFLLLHCVILAIYAVLAMLVLSDATHNLHAERLEAGGSGGKKDNLSAMDIWMEIPSLISKHLMVIIVLLWSCTSFMALEMMTVQHMNNIRKNLTINEQMNWRRYSYMTQSPLEGNSNERASGAMVNAFDRGFKTNVVEFFFRSGHSAVDYHKVFTIPTRGLDPVMNTAEDTTVREREDRDSGNNV